MSDGWKIREASYSAETAKAYEGLFTQGSGYLHVRGSIEEHFSDTPQNVTYTRMPANVTSEKFPETKAKWGTYVPGVYGKHPLLNWELINLPWFLEIGPTVAGERLDMEKSRIEGYTRELDLASGTLRRSLVWQTESGEIEVTFERFASAERKHVFVQRVTLSSKSAIEVVISGGIDSDVRTNGYDHFTAVELREFEGSGVECSVTTDGGDTVRTVSRFTAPDADWKATIEPRRATLSSCLLIPAGGTLTVEKRTAVTTSRDIDLVDAGDVLREVAGMSFEQLADENQLVWDERWRNSDVRIDGDPEGQLAMRTSLFHLHRCHVPDDDRVAIDAKGYAGDAYFGRFFWDTEIYLLPFFLYTDPDRARTLVDFRVRTLPGARDNAADYGYPGARFPWESDSFGRESCSLWQYRDHEIHVTADVVYGMVHYAVATQTPGFLVGDAADVITDTARYWIARMDRRPDEEHPSILGVMGPDEYSPITSNNSYTNRIVSLNLAIAAQVGQATGVAEEECAAWAEAARALPVLQDENGLTMQCEEWEHFAEPDFERFWLDRSKTFAAQVSQERLYRTKCLKQGDVTMMMVLFPRDFTDEEAKIAWDYYLPYTTHDSSLSAGTHAILACRLGLSEEAWKFWRMSSGIDLDIKHGAVAEGIHIASSGANWQIAVNGFAGMASAMETTTLTFNPKLPAAWTRLAFPVVWNGCRVQVDLNHTELTLTNYGECELPVVVAGREATLFPTGILTFSYKKEG